MLLRAVIIAGVRAAVEQKTFSVPPPARGPV
jgi:hypothetical protein